MKTMQNILHLDTRLKTRQYFGYNHLRNLQECFSTPFRNSSTSLYGAKDHISLTSKRQAESSPGPGKTRPPFHAPTQSCISIDGLKHRVSITPMVDTKMSSCHKLLPNHSHESAPAQPRRERYLRVRIWRSPPPLSCI